METRKKKAFRHVTYEDRLVIKNLLDAGATFLNISLVLGFTVSTIQREINRGGGRKNYSVETAMKNSGKQRKDWIV